MGAKGLEEDDMTIHIPSQLCTAGDHIYGPATKAAGQNLVSLQMAAPSDWQNGKVGRVIAVRAQHCVDGKWADIGSGSLVSPNMGDKGVWPTVTESDITNDPVDTQYQMIVNFSADTICGWNLITK